MGDTLIEDSNGQKVTGDMDSQLQALEEKARKAQEAFEREEKLRKELEEQNVKLLSERNAMQRQLDGEKGSLSEYMEKSLKLAAQKADLESQLSVRTNFYFIFRLQEFLFHFWIKKDCAAPAYCETFLTRITFHRRFNEMASRRFQTITLYRFENRNSRKQNNSRRHFSGQVDFQISLRMIQYNI